MLRESQPLGVVVEPRRSETTVVNSRFPGFVLYTMKICTMSFTPRNSHLQFDVTVICYPQNPSQRDSFLRDVGIFFRKLKPFTPLKSYNRALFIYFLLGRSRCRSHHLIFNSHHFIHTTLFTLHRSRSILASHPVTLHPISIHPYRSLSLSLSISLLTF